ncbi:MAG: hypothetical protein MR508_05475 [Lachnospiraceae bacterium]|nr:hypothetical protein [Lachnospiraceae bacterium]
MKCFDTLKLDKSLIHHIGVENDDRLSYLQKLHCDDIQGFLFARPMPMDDFASMLNKN